VTPLNVDFLIRNGPGRWLWGLLAFLAAMAAGLVGWNLWVQRQVYAAQDQLTQARAHASLKSLRPSADVIQSPLYQASAEAFLKAAQANWPEALRSLEAAAMPGVVMKSLEYDGAALVLRVEITLEQPGLLPDYLLALHAGEDMAAARALWTVQWVRRLEGTHWGAALARPVIP